MTGERLSADGLRRMYLKDKGLPEDLQDVNAVDFSVWLFENIAVVLDRETIINTIVYKAVKKDGEHHNDHLNRVADAIASNPDVAKIIVKPQS